MIVVVNPLSKVKNKTKIVDDLRHKGAVIYETTGNNDAKEIKKLLSKSKPDKVVVLGGDGTVNMVGQLLVDTKIPLAIIPAGSTNGLFYDVSNVVRPLEERKLISIDAIKIDDTYCFHFADFGINATIMEKSKQNKFNGFFKYVVSFFNSLFHINQHVFKVNSKKIKSILLVIANGKSFGHVKNLNSKGSLTDGEFEIITLNKQWSYKKVIIENIDGAAFHIDGEFAGHPKKIAVQIKPSCLVLLV